VGNGGRREKDGSQQMIWHDAVGRGKGRSCEAEKLRVEIESFRLKKFRAGS
jgi:hypothetical protein